MGLIADSKRRRFNKSGKRMALLQARGEEEGASCQIGEDGRMECA